MNAFAIAISTMFVFLVGCAVATTATILYIVTSKMIKEYKEDAK